MIKDGHEIVDTFFLFSLTASLEKPTVYTYPSVDGSLKVVTTFVSESEKDYSEIIPMFAELFDVEVSVNLLCCIEKCN